MPVKNTHVQIKKLPGYHHMTARATMDFFFHWLMIFFLIYIHIPFDDDDELKFNDASTHGVILRLEGHTAL